GPCLWSRRKSAVPVGSRGWVAYPVAAAKVAGLLASRLRSVTPLVLRPRHALAPLRPPPRAGLCAPRSRFRPRCASHGTGPQTACGGGQGGPRESRPAVRDPTGAVPPAALALIEHRQCFRFVRLHSGHRLGLRGRAELILLREGSGRE